MNPTLGRFSCCGFYEPPIRPKKTLAQKLREKKIRLEQAIENKKAQLAAAQKELADFNNALRALAN